MYELEIGKRIKELRQNKKLTQENLAETIGLTTGHISAIERGVNSPSIETLIMILNTLECSADELFSCVLNVGYKTRSSCIADRLENLSPNERDKILNVLEVMINDAEKE